MSVKLMRGDCLELMQDIEAGSIDMVLCDLPYGTTSAKWDAVIPFEPLWEQYKRVCKPSAAIVLFSAEPFTSALIMSNPKMFRYDLIWTKGRGSDFLLAKKKPLRAHENICVFYRRQPTYNAQFTEGEPYTAKQGGITELYDNRDEEILTVSDGRRYPLTVLNYQIVSNTNRFHPSQKPIELLSWIIRTYTNEGETVLDNTMGSGSTGVACVNTNRNFIGIELDEAYYETACKRIKDAQAQPRLFEVG